MMKRILIFLVVLFAYISLYSNSSIILDVHIIDQVQLTILTESDIFYIQSEEGIETIESSTLSVTVSNRILTINDNEYGDEVYIISEHPLLLNDISYSGEFKILTTPNNLVRVINRLNLEDYVSGVIAVEIGGNALMEALKAQAVATRTITISKMRNSRHRNDGYDLCSATHCQVYRGLTGQTTQSIRAVQETANMVLLYEEFGIQNSEFGIPNSELRTLNSSYGGQLEPIEAVYSSHCGGISENSGDLWVMQHNYLSSKVDNYCINIDLVPSWSQRFINWEKDFTINELETMFSIQGITEISTNIINSSMRVEEVLIKSASRDVLITGQYELRERFDLLSSLFIIQREGDNVKFIGNGHGHGVGMCQIGAIVRANQGHDFREILGFYFEGTVIGVLN